ncbi:glycosyltransferase family protein [Methylomonas fluvii]|uniref:Glycosyltransferase family 1 protein n=1 Tax=Methylomonas fluvii TaxID=1854564 RepID=A0ABR9DJH5_9GAMM|nr:glycosyltransferase [Methylomonas fluvii]MBD9362047.1 glycosyltransferase family 1 protein [Methylomonas fluvii]
MPRNTLWYQGVARQIARGFRAFDIEVSFHCGLLDEADLLQWINNYNPQLIFEMNRPRGDISFLPRHIVHICWVVDFNGRPITDFNGSDITYLFGPKWIEKFPFNSFYRWFGPGACEQEYFPEACEFKYQSSFIGHIPRPWSPGELSRNISSNDKRLLFSEVLPELEKNFIEFKSRLKIPEDYVDILYDIAENVFGSEVVLDNVLKYDLSGRLIRLLNRQQLLDKILDITNLAIFGPANWLEWPNYKNCYHRFLETSEEMRWVYCRSRFNFHENGNGMHFRVMDCMASGGLIFIPKGEYDDRTGGIKNFFMSDKHYVEFDIGDLEDKYQFYVNNPRQAQKIRYSAAVIIRENHTWTHRVKSILDDLMYLGYKIG